jgi:hypothetical protein
MSSNSEQPTRPSEIDHLAAVVDEDARKRVKEWDRGTCGFHARMMATLCGGEDKMGPRVREIYDQLMADADEPPVAHETQIVYLFRQAMLEDAKEG